MRVKVISDVHFEFTDCYGQRFTNNLNADDCDVLIIAGDLSNCRNIGKAYRFLCNKFKHVIHVLGNHEYYGNTREVLEDKLADATAAWSNLDILDNRVVEIEGVRFVGSTLWFPKTKMASYLCQFWSDFNQIRDLKKWVYQKNEESVKFLTENVREGDFVITHHLPSYQSVNSVYKNEDTNCFFVCPMDELIKERKPKVWLHGHTHCSCDYKLGDTRVLCNPFGYWNRVENENFDPNLIIEMP